MKSVPGSLQVSSCGICPPVHSSPPGRCPCAGQRSPPPVKGIASPERPVLHYEAISARLLRRPSIEFDSPEVRIGVAEYEDGPDGLGPGNAILVADRVFNVSAQSACRSCSSRRSRAARGTG
jgi:hypothetical protein